MRGDTVSEIDKTFREGGLGQLARLIANPARSGIYLSRSGIRRIGAEMGLSTGVQSRSRMLESLFRDAGADGCVEELLDRLIAEAERWLGRYREWARACPPAKSAWKDWGGRTREFRRSLRRAKKWARTAAREATARNARSPE